MQAGFVEVRTRDRNEWYTAAAAAELAGMREGPVAEALLAAVGAEARDSGLCCDQQLAAASQLYWVPTLYDALRC